MGTWLYRSIEEQLTANIMNKGTLYFNQMIQWSMIDGKQSYSIPFTLTEKGTNTLSKDIEASIESILIQRGYHLHYVVYVPNHAVVTIL